MEEEGSEKFVLKTSRIYFLGNYLIAFLVAVFIVLLVTNFKVTFTLTPKTVSELISTIAMLGIAAIGIFMIEQPEWARFKTRFIITMNEVIKEHGILGKERVILPYATVADISVHRSVLGRILNYGTLSVSSFKSGSDMVMNGVRNPEKYHVVIQNRVNMIREGQIRMFKDQKSEDGESPVKKKKTGK